MDGGEVTSKHAWEANEAACFFRKLYFCKFILMLSPPSDDKNSFSGGERRVSG